MTTVSRTQPTPVGSVSLWDRLSAPHPSITDIEQRRQSRLLSALALTLLVTTLLAEIVLTAKAGAGIPSTVIFVIPGQIITLAVYLANRAGHYRLAATVFVLQNYLLVLRQAWQPTICRG